MKIWNKGVGGGVVDKLLCGNDGIFGMGEDKKGFKLNKMSSKRLLSKHVMQQKTNHLEKYIQESRN